MDTGSDAPRRRHADLLGSLFDDPPAVGGGVLLGDCELIEELASGGMGVVWRARQRSLGRMVAVKTIRSAHLARPEDVARFRAEASATAALRHPGIVTVHDIGSQDGQHYFVMELVEGPSLAGRLRDGPMEARAGASLLQGIAEAVQHAHEQGVLHRDLKPSNILLRPDGRPCVSDFGLARALHSDSDRTLSGTVLGSPSYMPPEQARGRVSELDVRSDVYSLGAILYEVLTGRPPFRGESPVETLKHVVENEPVAPRWLRPEVPRDLETICLKCLSKEPQRRYADAAGLAQDLGRFLSGEPIAARPTGVLGRAVRWTVRKPALAMALGAVMLVGMVGAIGVLIQWRRAVVGELLVRQTAYDTAMLLGDHALQARNYGLVRSVLQQATPGAGAPDLRSWEWRYLRHEARGRELLTIGRCGAEVSAVAVSPDGALVAAGDVRGEVTVWKVADQSVVAQPHRWDHVRHLRFSPRGDLMVVVTRDGQIHLYDAITWRLVRRIEVRDWVMDLRFSGDGGRLEVIAREAYLTYEASTGSEVHREVLPVVLDGTFDSATHRAVLVSRTNSLEFVSLGVSTADRQTVAVPAPWTVQVTAIGPEGRLAMAGYNDATARVWEPSTGRALLELRGHTEAIRCAAFRPDRPILATGGADQTILLWELSAGRIVSRCIGHTDVVTALAFSADGHHLVSGGVDRTVRWWSGEAQLEEPTMVTLPTGRMVTRASGTAERMAHVLYRERCLIHEPFAGRTLVERDFPGLTTIQLDDAGGVAALGFEDGRFELRQVDAREFPVIATAKAGSAPVNRIGFSRDGRRMLTCTDGVDARLWERDGMRETWQRTNWANPLGFVRLAAFTADGEGMRFGFGRGVSDCMLLSGSARDAGKLLAHWPARTGAFLDLATSRDGRHAAVVFEGAPAELWEIGADGGMRLVSLVASEFVQPSAVAFSWDGRRLALGSAIGQVMVINLGTLRPVAMLKASPLAVARLWFSAGDEFLVAQHQGAVSRWRAPRVQP